MGIVERKQRQREEVRDGILRAAWALVQEEGWQSLSIRKIADAIEYSVPVIYSHFENKDAILQEFTKEGFRKLNNALDESGAQEKNPAAGLMLMAKAYWHFAFQNKEYYQLMYGLGMPTCEKVRQVPELSKFTDLLHGAVKNLITNSKNAETDSFLKFHTFWSMLHGLVSINMVERTACPDSLHELVLEDAVRGFIKNIQD
ncbi:TetR/AcrR family transcriptional regulator [Adhaeribacter rhizoryzae]|uniref:TetR/AcrR family transcriptional regulator n=1 Tax=Adhaeribacter rhizoryzae TaxID=2607907 RepID=A0A5M6DR86_9BACT|nr:TetR/AcrR family transcriptional regulator [Adhaeribacter rhizoryzae]KAA5548866.1 TetR/AcrR family transcriptional regulator [Adhaeribacter rhizoryzae]